MSISLLELPPESLLQILATVSVKTLLRFSQCSHYAHSLASSSLHTLKLDFGPAPSSCGRGSCISARGMLPRNTSRSSVKLLKTSPLADHIYFPRSSLNTRLITSPTTNNDPYKILVQIPDAHGYDFATHINLHSALVPSILARHQGALQLMELNIWTLTVPMSKAISQLSALRCLSIKLNEDHRLRSLARKYVDVQRNAWRVLAQPTAWSGRLRSLRIENADLFMSHLGPLLQENTYCQELRLRQCEWLGTDLWSFLGSKWKGGAALEILEVADCGGLLNESELNLIEELEGLKYLNLRGCAVSYTETVERWKSRMGHVAKVIPPRSHSLLEGNVLEVDSDYATDEDN